MCFINRLKEIGWILTMVLFLIRFLNIRGESSTTECLKVCPNNLESTCNKKKFFKNISKFKNQWNIIFELIVWFNAIQLYRIS